MALYVCRMRPIEPPFAGQSIQRPARGRDCHGDFKFFAMFFLSAHVLRSTQAVVFLTMPEESIIGPVP